jgi:hypothetical protein
MARFGKAGAFAYALSEEESNHIAEFLELGPEVAEALTEYATKGETAATER